MGIKICLEMEIILFSMYWSLSMQTNHETVPKIEFCTLMIDKGKGILLQWSHFSYTRF